MNSSGPFRCNVKVTIALAAVSVLSMFSCQPEPAEIRVASISLSNSTLELTVGDYIFRSMFGQREMLK